MKKKHKFKIGDRVVYRYRGQGGNGWLDGEAGVVKHISDYGSHYDYDVEFDRIIPENMGLAHFGIRDGHGWACTEEHLQAEGSDEEDGDPDTKKQEKEEENTMKRDYMKWTEEQDKLLLDMKAEGKSFLEMATTLQVGEVQAKNRLYYLRKVKGKFGLSKDEPAESKTDAEIGRGDPSPMEKQETVKAELNELEETLAAVISEQKEEIDFLQGRVRGLESEVAARTEEAMDAKRMAVRCDERVAELERELKAMQEALEIAETAMDEERQAKELLAKELTQAREALDKSHEETMEEIKEALHRYDVRIKEISEERDRYLRLVIKQAEGLVGL